MRVSQQEGRFLSNVHFVSSCFVTQICIFFITKALWCEVLVDNQTQHQ